MRIGTGSDLLVDDSSNPSGVSGLDASALTCASFQFVGR